MVIKVSREEATALLKAVGEYRFVTRCCDGDCASDEFALVGSLAARFELALADEIEAGGASYEAAISEALAYSQAGWAAASGRLLYPYAFGKRRVA